MERRTFLNMSTLAFGSMLIPVAGRAIAAAAAKRTIFMYSLFR